MDMLSYLLGKNNGGGNPAKRFDYIIDMRSIISTTTTEPITIINDDILEELNEISSNILDTEKEIVKPLKIGVYISGNNQEGYDSAFIESTCIDDCTNYRTGGSQRSGYLAFRITFPVIYASSAVLGFAYLDYTKYKTGGVWTETWTYGVESV